MFNITNINYKRKEDESEYEFIYRIGQLKDTIGTWQDIADILNSELGYEYTESKYRKQIQAFNKIFDANKEKFNTEDTYTQTLSDLKREIQTERYKLQAEKTENNRWLRENARDELIVEKIIYAVKELEPVIIPEKIWDDNNKKAAVLAFGDEHYGTSFTIMGLFREVINEYNPEVFEFRMWTLLEEVKNIIRKEDISTLYVYSLGDSCDGIIRVGQLTKLKYGVIEGTIRYSNFICTWLNELSKYVAVKFQSCVGNHTQLRMLGQPKGTFENENMGFIVNEFIKVRLENNPNFTFLNNPTGYIFDDILGYKILGIHGEVKDLEKGIKDFSNTYNVQIDYLIGGHYHHGRTEVVGVNREIISIPSIIGIDDFSMSLNKTSNAGAELMIFEDGKGKTVQYSIKLN